MILGYARTSTAEQVAGLDAQIRDLKSAGCERILHEHASAIKERPQLKAALDFCTASDVLVVTKLDRLARSTSDLQVIIKEIESKGIMLRILNLGADTATPTGKLLLNTLGAIAQFEREIMLERQKEGIEKAKAEGKYKGREPIPQEIRDEVIRLSGLRWTRKHLAHKFGIGVSTVYMLIKQSKSLEKNGTTN
jgi:DNA invertase Pin-like site-specific DNA recombinase